MIQGSSADMMKTAIKKVFYHILEEDLFSIVKMTMQVHDQLDCVVDNRYTEQWAVTQTQLMEDAAKVFIPSGILKAETTITERWSK